MMPMKRQTRDSRIKEDDAFIQGTASTAFQSSDITRLGADTAEVASSLFSTKIITILIAGLSFIVVSRLLGPSTYGIYVLAISVTGLLASLGNMGIANSFSKFIAEYKAGNKREEIGHLLSSGYLITTLIGLALVAVMIGFSGFISSSVFGGMSYVVLISISSLVIISSMLYSISLYATIGFGMKIEMIWTTVIQVTTQAVISIALAFAGFGAYAPIAGLVLGLLAGTAAVLLFIVTKERIRFGLPTSESVRMMLGFSTPLGIASAAGGLVSNVSNIILKAFSSTTVVGNVGVAQKVGNNITLLSDSVSYPLLPLFASAKHNKLDKGQISKIYDYAIYAMFLLFVPLAFFVFVFSREISYLLFGVGYQLVSYYLSIISIGVLIGTVSDYTMALLMGNNKVKSVMKIGTGVAIVELLLLLALIPFLKGYGLVAVVSVITPLLTFTFFYRTAAKELGVKIQKIRIAKVLCAGAICIIASIPIILLIHGGTFINDLLIVGIATAEQILLYPIVVAKLRGVGKKDLETLEKISANIPLIGQVMAILTRYTALAVKDAPDGNAGK
jgi:O-antigen/teichoic acid export membrane protein